MPSHLSEVRIERGKIAQMSASRSWPSSRFSDLSVEVLVDGYEYDRSFEAGDEVPSEQTQISIDDE